LLNDEEEIERSVATGDAMKNRSWYHNPVTNLQAASSQCYRLLKKDKKGFDFLVIRK
jgi:hypothetical protein